MKKRPLIHIGYCKTGTTWLQNHVFANPEFGFSTPLDRALLREKIAYPHDLQFDPDALRSRIEAAIDKADEDGLVPVFSEERFAGLIHAGGIDSRILADRLAQVFPTGRFLIVVREQKSMIRSAYAEYIKVGGSLALRHYLTEYLPMSLALFDYDYYKYSHLVKYYQHLFGKDRVLVLPYEHFCQSPQGFVRAITDFCEVELPDSIDRSQVFGARANIGLDGFELFMLKHLHFWFGYRCPHNYSSVMPIMPRRRRGPVRFALNYLSRLLPRAVRERFNAGYARRIAQRVGDRYHESNQELARITGLELKSYGYELSARSPVERNHGLLDSGAAETHGR